MRALLDTHVLLWADADDPRLSTTARSVIEDGANEIVLSAVSAWEIAIKYRAGRLQLPYPPAEYVSTRLTVLGLTPLSIDFQHAVRVASLPQHHTDPFDRLLVAQSQIEGLPIITSDPMIARYGVDIVW